ncbi:hypothetical protein BDV95DRAFT_67187 [Massariosphaeria phaeospora]|uniref:rRNA-processing protein FYV7 n=1 Tax=Massariosphaeria phaeospora TaxID=100035 RepID=A0A7C8I9K7_9PLEO|nr:hypothetical protein BDV95DRAFT_67187 [Massariosphaeria phaeospora]
MAPKRPHEGDTARPAKKQNKGFSVGPANLPDGTYKRKVQKIKKDLIHKAKVKKQYAKLKTREGTTVQKSVYDREEHSTEATHEHTEPAEPTEPVPEPSLAPHPDRVKLLEEESPEPESQLNHKFDRRQKRPRTQPFQKEEQLAQQRRDEAEARQRFREESEKERQRRLAERERFRKTMAKARGGPDGKRKLGRESTVLLEKAKRLVGKT